MSYLFLWTTRTISPTLRAGCPSAKAAVTKWYGASRWGMWNFRRSWRRTFGMPRVIIYLSLLWPPVGIVLLFTVPTKIQSAGWHHAFPGRLSRRWAESVWGRCQLGADWRHSWLLLSCLPQTRSRCLLTFLKRRAGSRADGMRRTPSWRHRGTGLAVTSAWMLERLCRKEPIDLDIKSDDFK